MVSDDDYYDSFDGGYEFCGNDDDGKDDDDGMRMMHMVVVMMILIKIKMEIY